MKNWGVDNSDTPLVSVKCMTFNQEKYISQALDGFLKQKTDFPFEILVHDDASTDKTADIIRDYTKRFSKIIKPIYETENQFTKGNGAHHVKIDAMIKGKYIAFCEGDDYWIDEKKLEKQVSFLEKNKNYGMCYSRVYQYLQSDEKYSKYKFGEKIKNYETLFIYGCKIPTNSVICRKQLLDEYQKVIEHIDISNWKMGDLPKWLFIYKNSKVKFFKDIMSVYRILEESASHSIDKNKIKMFRESSISIRKSFLELYPGKNYLELFSNISDFSFYWDNRLYCEVVNVYKKIPLQYRTLKIFGKYLISQIRISCYKSRAFII